MRLSAVAIRSAALVALISLAACAGHAGLTPGNSLPQSSQPVQPPAGTFALFSVRPLSDTPACAGSINIPDFGVTNVTYKQRGGGSNLNVDATGCDIGILITNGDNAQLQNSSVANAGEAGIFILGASNVQIQQTQVFNIANGTTILSGAIVLDGATGLSMDHIDMWNYGTVGFAATFNSSFHFDHSTATGSGTASPQAQIGFLAMNSQDQNSDHPTSEYNQGTGAAPGFLGGQSYGYYLCGVTDQNGNPITLVSQIPNANHAISVDNTNFSLLRPSC